MMAFEAIGLSFYKSGHLAAITVTEQRQTIGVDGILLQGLHRGPVMMSAIISAAEIVFVGSGKSRHHVRCFRGDWGRSTCPSLSDKKVDQGIVAILGMRRSVRRE